MAKVGLWSRVGGWIRNDRRRFGSSDDPLTKDGAAGDRGGAPGDNGDPSGNGRRTADRHDLAAADRITTALSRGGRRDVSLRKLQEGYDRVLELMDQMQQHMLTQENRTEAIATSLGQLNDTLSDVAQSDRQRTELISAIAAELETTKIRTQQLADALSEMPRAVREQTDALTGMQKQLEMGTEADANLDATLQSFGRGVDRLSESTDAQAKVLRDLQAADEMRGLQISEILNRQTRQFTILVVFTAVLSAAAIGGGVIALVMQLG